MLFGDPHLEYEVIPKREIPPPVPGFKHMYGEWAALARTIRILEPGTAVKCRLPDGLSVASALRSLHSACYAAGARVSTQFVSPHLYIVRRQICTPGRDTRWREARCDNCQGRFIAKNKQNRLCPAPACKLAARQESKRRHEEKRRAARVAAGPRHRSLAGSTRLRHYVREGR